ncbi:MAG TPA: hypothetical protein VFN26_13650 [Candidatus Acidoferrum sp.]|nr:hypothetical protein [Candidatus Acidoferrum sp.]
MLRCVFVGSPNRFTMLLTHWLSMHTDLRGVIRTSSAYWFRSLKGRLQFARKRLKRVGFLKTCDEALYYLLVHRKFLYSSANTEAQTRLIDFYVSNYGLPDWHGDSISTDNINSPAVLQFVSERQPDLIMSMCLNDYFGRNLREIPRLGCFLWHEGITPEYKGHYSPFWAIHNLDLNMLGYTVLRMNHRYDEGEVFLQGPAVGVNPVADSPHYIGHKAVLDSLPAVGEFFGKLEKGSAVPLSTANRRPATYTYPGLSDGMRFAVRLKRLNAGDLQSRELVKPVSRKNA